MRKKLWLTAILLFVLFAVGATLFFGSVGFNAYFMWVVRDSPNPKLIAALIKNGADVNATDKNGTTALMWAAKANHLETIITLIDNGADVDSRDVNGKTARDYAADNYSLKMLGHKAKLDLVKGRKK
jgi:hypothetical protein